MHTRTNLPVAGGTALLICLLASPFVAHGQTPLPGGLAIQLLPDYAHEPLQGIDSIVGRIARKGGLQIQYEIGRIPQGAFRLGGDYVNQARQLPEQNRAWSRHQIVGGHEFDVAYGKDGRLIVSTAFETKGVNFSTTAKSPEEVADVLLMVLSLAKHEQKRDE